MSGKQRMAKSRLKEELSQVQLDDVGVNVWSLAKLAAPDEREQLRDAVRMLDTSEGRSSLIVKYGARME